MFGLHKQRMINRYNFYASTQQPGETFTQFANRLRDLAVKCEFNDPEEELHYRFIMGMLPGPERTMLFTVEMSQPLTFARAVEFVEGVRYTRGATSEWVTPLQTACENATAKPFVSYKEVVGSDKSRLVTPGGRRCKKQGCSFCQLFGSRFAVRYCDD